MQFLGSELVFPIIQNQRRLNHSIFLILGSLAFGFVFITLFDLEKIIFFLPVFGFWKRKNCLERAVKGNPFKIVILEVSMGLPVFILGNNRGYFMRSGVKELPDLIRVFPSGVLLVPVAGRLC